MTDYRANPQLSQAALEKITEEIPSGVSADDVSKTLSILESSEETVNFIANHISTSLKRDIDVFWNDFQVNEKLQNLKTLEEAAPKTKAWRPCTGKVDLKPIEGKYLLERKKALLEKTEAIDSELFETCNYITKWRKLIDEQLKELKTCTSK